MTDLIFDGHNDVLYQLYAAGGVTAAPGFLTGLPGALDVPAARAGGFAAGFFAVYVPSPTDPAALANAMEYPEYDLPLPAPIPADQAVPVVMAQAAILFELERLGALKVCRTTADIRAALAQGIIAAIFHIEGAEAVDADLHMLDVLYQAGLRSLGPVWSRPTIFAEGVPFRYPSGPDIGGGLTAAGKALVARCNTLGIMLDLSHMNEAGFWDVARLSDAPLVATHSNAHAVCPHSRNLTDDQLRAIRDSGGMVGLNFAVAFLRSDGQKRADVPLAQMLQHLDHMLAIAGEDHVGIGSDYDGALVPAQLTKVSDLPALPAAMAAHGYSPGLIAKICRENWLRVLYRTWGT
jgi:membrane dipeptidase